MVGEDIEDESDSNWGERDLGRAIAWDTVQVCLHFEDIVADGILCATSANSSTDIGAWTGFELHNWKAPVQVHILGAEYAKWYGKW